MRPARPPWMESPTVAGRLTNVVILTVVVLLMVLPFLSIVATSVASTADVARGGGMVFFPRQPNLDAYRTILNGGVVSRALFVSVGITLVGTSLSMLATIGMAYGLSRPIIGGKPILLIALFTFLFAPGIIPSFLLVKQLGLLNTYSSLILPALLTAYNLVILRAFFMSIPRELIDAARIDGAGDLGILFRIVLPLSKAPLAVIALFYAVRYWNSFFGAMLYLNDSTMWPMQLVLRYYVLQGTPIPGAPTAETGAVPPPPGSVQMAVVVLATIPILIIYPLLQKHFTKGVLVGAIKG